jgi:hypothetical protein
MGNKITFVVLLIILLPFVYSDGAMFSYYKQEIHESSQTAIIKYQDNIEELFLMVSYGGNVSDFAWIVPVPNIPELSNESSKLFFEIAEITQPKIIDDRNNDAIMIHKSEQIGYYNSMVISADNSNELLDWLKSNNYHISNDQLSDLEWYVEKKWFFVVLKINNSLFTESNEEILQPIRLSFESEQIIYPLKISRGSAINSFDYIEQIQKYYPELNYENDFNTFIDSFVNKIATEIFNDFETTGSDSENKALMEIFGRSTKATHGTRNYHYDDYLQHDDKDKWLKNEISRNIKRDCRQQCTKVYNDKDVDGATEIIFNEIKSGKRKSTIMETGQDSQGKTLYEKIKENYKEELTKEVLIDKWSDWINRELEDNYHMNRLIQNNGKANKIIIYIISDNKAKADGFELDFAKQIKPNEYKYHPNFDNLFDKTYFLTKLSRNMDSNEMTNDVLFEDDVNNKSFRKTVKINNNDLEENINYKFWLSLVIIVFIPIILLIIIKFIIKNKK